MKKILFILSIIVSCTFAQSQDTIYVYSEEGMLRIDDLVAEPIFLTPGAVSIKVFASEIKVKDQLTKIEYNLGAYNEIFDLDTNTFTTQDSALMYLNKLINRRVSDINIQDQASDLMIIKFNRIDASSTIKYESALNDSFIVVNSATGADSGDYLIAFSPLQKKIYKGNILSVVSDTIYIDTPLDTEFDIGDYVDYTTTNMNVNGQVSTQTFGIRGVSANPVRVSIDITRLIFHCQTTAAVDLSKFGDIAGGITNGLVLRHRDGTTTNIFNAKTNGELAALGYDFTVLQSSNPAQGQNGFLFRLTFAGQNKMGVVIRLEPGEDLEFLVRDDLTDLDLLEVTAEGHIVED